MANKYSFLSVIIAICVAVAACKPGAVREAISIPDEPNTPQIEPDREAMQRFAGIWVDAETDAVIVMVRGDSIFYPDTTSLPARFVIFDDTLLIFGANNMRYPISHQGDYTFDYVSLNGEEMHMRRSDNPDDSLLFMPRHYAPIMLQQLVKRDTLVYTPHGERYHLYIDINPTSRKVFKSSYTDEGMAVQQVYYDNIIHVSVYEGRRKVYSRDIDKHMFDDLVPASFLDGALLSNMEFGRTDNQQTTFHATLCEPDGARCYVVDLHVGFDGQMTPELTGY